MPATILWEVLVSQLSKWRKEGNQLFVCLNTNEDIYKKAVRKTLTNIDRLAMKESGGGIDWDSCLDNFLPKLEAY
jgi:hypothetical protein